MTDEPTASGRLDRRDLLKGALAAGFASGLVPNLPAAEQGRTGPDLIRVENAKPGATDWQLTRVRVDASGYRSRWIEGYCSQQSVQAGDAIDIMVSTNPPRPFHIEIFRMGYY